MSNNDQIVDTSGAASIPSLSDFVVVKRSDLQKLTDAVSDLWDSASDDGCEEPYFVGDMNHLQAVRQVESALRGAQSLDRALRRVDGDQEQGNDPILVVVPAGLSDESAVLAMNKAIEAANAITNNGEDGTYFEALQEQLGQAGIAIQEGIELLHSTPWDADTFPTPDRSPDDYLEVAYRSSPDEPDQIDPVGYIMNGDEIDESTAVEPLDGVSLNGVCTGFVVVYPRSDRYGVPEMATHSGAIKYLRTITRLKIAPHFDLTVEDSGDDTLLSFVVRALVHKDCVRVLERNAEESQGIEGDFDRFIG